MKPICGCCAPVTSPEAIPPISSRPRPKRCGAFWLRGYGQLRYRNDTGRNDFAVAKAAAFDDASFHSYMRTVEKISPRTDRHWMLLLLDSDQNAATGWLGYDFIVNLEVPGDTQTTVVHWQDGQWKTVGQGSYRVSGSEPWEIARKEPNALTALALVATSRAAEPPRNPAQSRLRSGPDVVTLLF
jgi:hypothetical protein